MNQSQLNALWLTQCVGEPLQAISISGVTVTIIYDSRTLQTMMVAYSSSTGRKLAATTVYVRKREAEGHPWEEWRSCAGDDQ